MKFPAHVLLYAVVLISFARQEPSVYICTAANATYFKRLVNLIGSLHASQFDDIAEIAVYDLGLTEEQKKFLYSIKKLVLLPLNPENPQALQQISIPKNINHPEFPYQNTFVLGAYAWKPMVFKKALNRWKDKPIIWLDAGTTVYKSLRPLAEHIKIVGYFLCTTDSSNRSLKWGTTKTIIKRLNLDNEELHWILTKQFAMAGVVGFSYKVVECLINPLFECSKDLTWFIDDGSTPDGYGTGRYEQTLLSLFAHLSGLSIFTQDDSQIAPIRLSNEHSTEKFYITWIESRVDERTHIYSSRNSMPKFDQFSKMIKRKG